MRIVRSFWCFVIVLGVSALTPVTGRAEGGYADYHDPAQGGASGITSVMVEGGPIASKHFQSGSSHFHERHGLGVVKLETQDYGNWGAYFLSPNSVDRTSVGFGYVTDPYVVPLGPAQLELTAALGLVSGYQDFPVPLLVGEGRFVMIKSGAWDAGLAMALLPYYTEDNRGDNKVGVVVTSPFLSIRYSFD